MKVLLKVGYTSYLLPSDAGLQTLVKALSQAVRVSDYTYRTENPRIELDDAEPMEVSIKYLPPRTKIVSPHAEREREKPLRLNAPTSIIIPPAE